MEKLVIFSDMDNQRVRILTSKGLRADTLLEMSKARQSEPQRADLNLHTRIYQPSAMHMFVYHVRTCGFISRQSALYRDRIPLRVSSIQNTMTNLTTHTKCTIPRLFASLLMSYAKMQPFPASTIQRATLKC